MAGYSETSEHEFSNEDEFFSTDNQFSLARYNADGSLDTAFSTDGIVITDIDVSGSFETGSAVAVQTDGKIVVAGTDNDRSSAIALIRYEGDTDAGGGDGAEDGDVQAFVTRFYRLVLGRDPDSGGLKGWVDGLLNGQFTGCDIATGFVFSPEFMNRNASDESYVDILYEAFFKPRRGYRRQNWLAE